MASSAVAATWRDVTSARSPRAPGGLRKIERALRVNLTNWCKPLLERCSPVEVDIDFAVLKQLV
eukprot:4644430-Pyramimonas_sp.AAC.1